MLLRTAFSIFTGIFFYLGIFNTYAQNDFPFKVHIQPLVVEGLGGLHSYAYGQWEGYWFFFGGRKDGIHARQPFNAFPEEFNNSEIILVNIQTGRLVRRDVNELPKGLSLQLQSTNLNYKQKGNHLILVGGYGYNNQENRYMTYPNLTLVSLPTLLDALLEGKEIASSFAQLEDQRFAVTGGQMGALGDKLLLVGGHRFDGRYNPMGPDHGPGFSQTYTHQVRSFYYSWEGEEVAIDNYEEWTDDIHLRRRDYNLVPQILEGGVEGYMISAGVFQREADLPFLYPVDINAEGIRPRTEFNQYLSHYHSGKVGLFDGETQLMHSLFFGGLSQYYYQDGQLYQDNNVPFVSTISRVTRYPDGSLVEFLMEDEMPGFRGTSAEFIPLLDRDMFSNGVIKLPSNFEDTLLIGHLYGGIKTEERNPFTTNRTEMTEADPSLFAVKLIRSQSTSHRELIGRHGFDFRISPNPARENFKVEFALDSEKEVRLFVSNTAGQILYQTQHKGIAGDNSILISIQKGWEGNILMVTLTAGNRDYATKKILAN